MSARPYASALVDALGADTVKQRAAEGDREAQWTLGYLLMNEMEGDGTPLGTAGRSPQADVGFAPRTA